MKSKNQKFTLAFKQMIDKYKEEHPGTTNEDLSDISALDMSTGAISDLCNGKTSNPTLAVLQKLHDFFGVSYSYLAGESGYFDNDSADLLNNEISSTKFNLLTYGKTYIVDRVIYCLKKLSSIPVSVGVGGDHDLSIRMDMAGDSIRGARLVAIGLDGIENITRSLVLTRDAAFKLTTLQVNSALLISKTANNEEGAKQELSKIIGEIASKRDIYSDLDKAVAAFKQDMDNAILEEVERLRMLMVEPVKEGEQSGNS